MNPATPKKVMTPRQLQKARAKLGLTREQLALLLGYEGSQGRAQVHYMENGERTIRPGQRRLIEAYLAGYRPKDWKAITQDNSLLPRIVDKQKQNPEA